MTLSNLQKEIYARNMALAEVGEAGQEKLLNASVLVVGNGGLGSPALLSLAAMGIGRIGLCDGDTISYSNLNRQILYNVSDVGKSKSVVASQRLSAINPQLQIDLYEELFTKNNALKMCRGYDMVVDCLDNFPSRLLLNDTCVELGIPFVHAGVYKYCGQTITVVPGQGPCLRCIFPQDQIEEMEQDTTNLSLDGIVGTTPGILGVIEAMEVFKYLLGLPVNKDGFAYFDGLKMEMQKIPVERDPHCICNKK